jgi:hypothetical protein
MPNHREEKESTSHPQMPSFSSFECFLYFSKNGEKHTTDTITKTVDRNFVEIRKQSKHILSIYQIKRLKGFLVLEILSSPKIPIHLTTSTSKTVCGTHSSEKGKKQSRNGLRDNETRGEVNRPASGSGGAHQQLPVRETHR